MSEPNYYTMESIPDGATAEALLLSLYVRQAWQAISLLNSWVNYGSGYESAGYYKDALGIVHLKGVIKLGTVTAGTALFNLPEGYRPANKLYIQTVYGNGSAELIASILIDNAGDMKLSGNISNNYLALDNIHFLAET